MIKFIQDTTEYTFRNEPSEVTLNELSKITDIMIDSNTTWTSKWMRVIELLGSQELVNVIDEDNLINAIENFNVTEVGTEITETIEVNGRSYSCVVIDGRLKISGKQLDLIEGYIKKGSNFIPYIVSVVYKDNDLADKEHYERAHIEHKAKLFGKSIMADVSTPITTQLSVKLADIFDRMSKLNAKA